jgi:hypothetical protein
MLEQYYTARKDRLIDIIADYFNDENTTAQTFYEEFKNELIELKVYHQKYVRKADTILELFDLDDNQMS